MITKLNIQEESNMRKKDQYEEHACNFKSEDECEEELEEDGLKEQEVEIDHFGEASDLVSGEIE